MKNVCIIPQNVCVHVIAGQLGPPELNAEALTLSLSPLLTPFVGAAPLLTSSLFSLFSVRELSLL